MKPDYLDQLMDQAKNAVGSDYRLAQTLEVSRQTVSDWRHGRKTCPIADQVLMAELSGLKTEEWAARALVAQYEGTSKGDKLFRALGKGLAVTGAVIASSGANAHQTFSTITESAIGYFIRCILLLSHRRHRRRRKRYDFCNTGPEDPGFFLCELFPLTLNNQKKPITPAA